MTRTYTFSQQGLAVRMAKRERSEAALLEAARELFSERGYDGVSVSEIGRRAGISHTLINTYFGGKAGLLHALVGETNASQEEMTRAVVASDGPALERLRRLLCIWAEADLADRRVLQVLQAHSWLWSEEEEARSRVARNGFLTSLETLIEQGRGEGAVLAGAEAPILREAVFGLYTWSLRTAVFTDLSPEATVEYLWPQLTALLSLPGL